MNPFIRDVIFATLLAFNFMAHVLTSVEATKRPKLKFVVFGDIGGVPYRPYSLWTQNLVSQHVAMVCTDILAFVYTCYFRCDFVRDFLSRACFYKGKQHPRDNRAEINSRKFFHGFIDCFI